MLKVAKEESAVQCVKYISLGQAEDEEGGKAKQKPTEGEKGANLPKKMKGLIGVVPYVEPEP